MFLMKLDRWLMEIGVKYTSTKQEVYSLTIVEDNLDAAIKFAKSKTIMNLKQKNFSFERVFLLGYEYIGSEERTNYDYFVELKQKEARQKRIMRQLNLKYPEYLYFDNFYQGKTKKLTYQKYLYFKNFMKDDQIRKRYKIPKIEFERFINSHL